MLLLAVITSFLLTFSTLPIIIRLFKAINLTDSPDVRKIHKGSTPSLGGLAIFFSLILAIIITTPLGLLVESKYFISALIIMLVLGMRDDIASLNANQKLPIQFLAAFIVVNYGGWRIESLPILFGLSSMPDYLIIGVSVLFIVAFTNSFNLIDGIDGLAGSVGVVSAGIMGLTFHAMGEQFLTLLCFSLASAMLSFLIYNWEPSRIFMGDTGSLVTGFVISCMSIQLFNMELVPLKVLPILLIDSWYLLVAGLLIIPIYDTLRVFYLRVREGRSPFTADSNHIHHILIKQGISHSTATILLMAFNLLMIVLSLFLQPLGSVVGVAIIVIVAVGTGYFCDRMYIRWRKARMSRGENRSIFISKSA